MSFSAVILKKEDKMDLEILKKIMLSIFTVKDYYYYMDYIKCDEVTHEQYFIGVQENQDSEDAILMYLYGEKDSLYEGVFDFIDTNLARAVYIEEIFDQEALMLNILYEYFKIYPHDYFYAGLDWFYTKNDIDKIYESKQWDDWCYKRP